MAETMFGTPKHKYLSDIISISSPSAAQGSVKELKREFQEAKTRTKKLRIAKATMLAANRARASVKKTNLSKRERNEFWAIVKIYDLAATAMFSALRRG